MGEQPTTNDEGINVCPVCGAKLIHEGGCMLCSNPNCGWSACG